VLPRPLTLNETLFVQIKTFTTVYFIIVGLYKCIINTIVASLPFMLVLFPSFGVVVIVVIYIVAQALAVTLIRINNNHGA